VSSDDVEPCAWDRLGDLKDDPRWRQQVLFADDDQGRGCDLRQPIKRIEMPKRTCLSAVCLGLIGYGLLASSSAVSRTASWFRRNAVEKRTRTVAPEDFAGCVVRFQRAQIRLGLPQTASACPLVPADPTQKPTAAMLAACSLRAFLLICPRSRRGP